MASEQQARRENTTTEREIHLEKNRVPKMASHFEALAEQAKESDLVTGGKDTPHGELRESQSVSQEKPKATSANTMGDVGSGVKARETHELRSQFGLVSGKITHEGDTEDDNQRGARPDRARSRNMVADKGAEAKHGGPTHVVGKFEMTGEEQGGKDTSEEARHRVGEAGERLEESKVGRQGGEDQGRKERESRVIGDLGGAKAGNAERKGECGQESSLPSLEDIGKYRGEAQQNTMEAIRAAEERYQKAKESAWQTLGSTAETAQEKTDQAKDVAYEKAKQAKDVAMKNASHAKEIALEKGQQTYTATKETLASAAKSAADYTSPVAEKAKDFTVQMAVGAKEYAKSAGELAAEKAVQAKDVTVESGKGAAESAGKMAVGLKDKATVVGWAAAHYTTEKTVEGTKAAVRAVEGVAEYAGHKAMELASKPISAAKDLAASTAETAKEYTARKKEEAQRELEAKKAGRQGDEQGMPSQTATGETFHRGQEQGEEGKGSTLGAMGETVSDIAKTTSQPLGSISGESFQAGQEQSEEGKGGGILQSVAETAGELAQKMKISEGNLKEEHFTRDQQLGKKGKESPLLEAVGETIVEIADTAKNLFVGDDPSAGTVVGIDTDASTTSKHGKHKEKS